MGRIDSAGRIIASLAGDVAHLERLQGVTGITTPNLLRAIQAGGLNPATATPEEVYRIHSALRLGEPLNLPGKPVEYVPPTRPSEAGPERMPVDQRVTAPNSRFLDTISEWDPAKADSLRAASADEILEAYRAGPPKKQKRAAKVTTEPATPVAAPPDQVAAESIASQFDAAVGGVMPEVAPRLDAGPRMDDVIDDLSMLPPPTARDVGDISIDTAVPRRPRPGRGKMAAAAAAAAGAGVIATMPGDRKAQPAASAQPSGLPDEDAPAFTSGGEADLAEETRPAPRVAATKETPRPTVKQAPQDYSMQARALINRLNDMRRAAGSEVPEAPAMMAEINRLVAMGNEQRREPTFVPGDDASSKYKQAQELITQVNAMYRQGMTPNSPQVQGLMRQVRSLQAAGDEMRNRRAG